MSPVSPVSPTLTPGLSVTWESLVSPSLTPGLSVGCEPALAAGRADRVETSQSSPDSRAVQT